jgi:hypothetical protein
VPRDPIDSFSCSPLSNFPPLFAFCHDPLMTFRYRALILTNPVFCSACQFVYCLTISRPTLTTFHSMASIMNAKIIS